MQWSPKVSLDEVFLKIKEKIETLDSPEIGVHHLGSVISLEV